ncbi:MAG: PTS sugar transporter subunit IIC [Lachnospiraceae bacterium]|nr:PTS sugar transporter subunit IIC [Lachnospiraceae bacterium]
MQKFIDKLTVWSEKLSQSFFLKVIMGGFMVILPLTMIGSFASLINGITWAPIQGFLAASGVGAVLSAIYQFTIGSMALFLAFSMGHSAGEQLELKKQSISIGVVTLVCFLVLTPYEVGQFGGGILPMDWTGATGMFSSIVCGFITAGVFKFCLDKNIAIKLPKQVPPMVSNQFTAIIPALFSILIAGIARYVMALTPFASFHNFIYTIIGLPHRGLGSNIFGAFVLFTCCAFLWFFGIHGGMIVMNMLMLVFTPLQMENLAAYQAGQPLPNMVTGQFISIGTGSLVILCIILSMCKSKTATSVAKLAIIPSFFGIDEPAYFGLPMIMNPIFFIPWVLVSNILSVFGTYLLNLTGLLPYASGASIGYNLPFFVTNFVSFGWKGVVWGFVFFALDFAICIPFVKAYDRQMLKREAEMEAQENA